MIRGNTLVSDLNHLYELMAWVARMLCILHSVVKRVVSRGTGVVFEHVILICKSHINTIDARKLKCKIPGTSSVQKSVFHFK